jgi:hypothetical protein
VSAAAHDDASAAMAELADLLKPAPSPNGTTTGGGRPAAYRTKDGKRVPGTTTITGRFKDAGGLIHWAWDLGCKGEDYRKVRDDAADAGSLAHEKIDADIHGREPEIPANADPELIALAQTGFEAFRAWRSQVNLEILDTERPLVSELYRFGGTYDGLGYASSVLAIIDWKSGNKLYVEHVIQCAAYRQLVAEHRGEQPRDAYLLRVGKEFGDFHFHFFPAKALDLAWDSFRHMRDLYDLDAKLKKVIG